MRSGDEFSIPVGDRPSGAGGWPAARAALAAHCAATVGVDRVFVAFPPSSAAVAAGVSAVLVPPARSGQREAGGGVDRRIDAAVTLMTPLDPGVQGGGSAAIDDAAEALTARLEGDILLGGAVTAALPIRWDEGDLLEFPPRSGAWFASQTGRVELIISAEYPRG